MKALLASIFVLGAACFFGYSLSTLFSTTPQSLEVTLLMTEKGLNVRPSEILYLKKRHDWDI